MKVSSTGRFVPLFVCVIVILIAQTLGLWRLDVESIWHDEAWSIRAIESPFGTPDDNTPPLYYITLHVLQIIGAGETPFALRYGSVLIFLLVVAFGFRVAYQWYGLTAGTLAGFLLAISPLLWEYAQEVRAYIAVPLFALMLLAGADALLRPRDTIPRRLWAFILISELAVLYTHNLSVPLVAWLNVMVIGILGWRTLRGDAVSGKRLQLWVMAQAVLLVLYVPWLLTQSPSGTSLNTVPTFNGELSRELWRGYVFPVIADPDKLTSAFITLMHILPLLAGIALMILMLRNRSLRAVLVVSQVILLPIFSTLLIIRASIDFHPRYYILAIPGVMLMLTLAVMSLPVKMRIVGALIVATSLSYVTQQSLSLIARSPEYQHDDFRALAEYYATLPEDAVILIPYDDEPTLTNYYAKQLDIKADFLLMPLDASPNEAITRINAQLAGHDLTHIELLTWFQVPADQRGMYGCLLRSSSIDSPNHFETYGLVSDGFMLNPPVVLQSISSDAMLFAPFYFQSAEFGESGDAVCLKTDWYSYIEHVRYPSIAVRLLNNLEWEIAVSDSQVVKETSSDHYSSGSAFSLLQLPEGTPAGRYEILLRLYTPEMPSGIDVSTSDNARSLGKDFHLGRISISGNPFDTPPKMPSLSRDNTENREIFSGQRLELEIINSFSDAVTLRLAGENWSLEADIPAGEPSLLWHAFQIPPDAEGEAVLSLDDIELMRYTIIATERVFTPPDVDFEIGTDFDEVATLYGATVEQRENEVQVDVVWQAQSTLDIDNVVFVQLLNADGQFLTGSDAQPAGGERPTTSWIPSEYITDSHLIKLDSVNYRGDATIIIGMYNPVNGERLRVASGTDSVQLPVQLEIR